MKVVAGRGERLVPAPGERDAPLEQITFAGRSEPFPVSEAAVELLNQRLGAARERAGADGETQVAELEERIGERLAKHLEDGMPSIDKATMRATIDFLGVADEPDEPEKPTSGLGRMLRGLRKGKREE